MQFSGDNLAVVSCCVHNNSGNGIVTDLTESFRLVSSGQGRVPATSRTVRSVSCTVQTLVGRFPATCSLPVSDVPSF